MIFDLLKDLNQDCKFSEKINESKFTENNYNKKEDNRYKNFTTAIICEYNPYYLNIPNSEKLSHLNKTIIEICSEIEETDIYNKSKLNSKIMKPLIVQYGLQMWKKNINHISSIYFLNEYYQKHFVIVYNDKLYSTSLKNYPLVYLIYNENKNIKLTESYESKLKNFNDINELFDLNIIINDTKKNLKYNYNIDLKAISKYKMIELKELAKLYNINLRNINKNKTKDELYNEIYKYKLNM